MDYERMLDAAHRQYGALSIESDVFFPTPDLKQVGIVVTVATHRGHYTARKMAAWDGMQHGADLADIMDALTKEAEMAALHKAGVRPGANQPEMTPADPLPSHYESRRPSPFVSMQSPGASPDVYPEPCESCGGAISDFYGGTVYLSAVKVVELGQAQHGRVMCAACSGQKAMSKAKVRK